MSQDHPGQGPSEGRQSTSGADGTTRNESSRQEDRRGGRDEFDHFFTDRGASAGAQDPDATAWAGGGYDADQTAAHPPYVRPPQQPQYDQPQYPETSAGWDEYEPAGQGYYQPAAYYEEPPQRRSAMWAPVAVIVASLAIVAVVIAIILNNSTGRMTEGAFTPTATVTETTTPTQSSGQSSSQSSRPSQSSTSTSSSSASSSSPDDYATSLPGSAAPCPGSDSYGIGPKTSCGFAAVVATLYNAEKDDNGDASFRAKSPTTHRKYAVSCHEDSYATCTTETGAIVYVLHR